MTQHRNMTTRGSANAPMLGALGALGLTMAALTLAGRTRRRSQSPKSDGVAALASYLRDHLAGADAAIQLVDHLKHTHHGTEEGALFRSLSEEFKEDRAVVAALVTDLGHSPASAKRVAGRAAGRLMQTIAGGDRGDLSLFRTLEGLAIGVQGKRCLWRAAQELTSMDAPGRRSFVELESDAVKQWEAIERCRRALAPTTFVALTGAAGPARHTSPRRHSNRAM